MTRTSGDFSIRGGVVCGIYSFLFSSLLALRSSVGYFKKRRILKRRTTKNNLKSRASLVARSLSLFSCLIAKQEPEQEM